MGGAPRIAAVAAISHASLFNHTQPHVTSTEPSNFNVNVFFVSAAMRRRKAAGVEQPVDVSNSRLQIATVTLCGVLVAVCAACWRKSPSTDKPEEVAECHGVYIVSGDSRLHQEELEMPGPPPAYETVVEVPSIHKDCHTLQETQPESCQKCDAGERYDSGLPSYEAAVMLRDTKL